MKKIKKLNTLRLYIFSKIQKIQYDANVATIAFKKKAKKIIERTSIKETGYKILSTGV